MMLRKTFILFVMAVLLAGCGAKATQAAATEITVEAADFAYSPASITVPVGQPVTLTMDNKGAVEHDFVVEKISVTDVKASNTGPAMHHQMGEMPDYDLHFFAPAGDQAVLNFMALEPGTYEIFCSIEGHKEAGMKGKLIVVDQE
jgi:uncharacterized cupredoxin-like copper-binding protein